MSFVNIALWCSTRVLGQVSSIAGNAWPGLHTVTDSISAFLTSRVFFLFYGLHVSVPESGAVRPAPDAKSSVNDIKTQELHREDLYRQSNNPHGNYGTQHF